MYIDSAKTMAFLWNILCFTIDIFLVFSQVR